MLDRAWQTGRAGDREADKRHFCNIPFVASRGYLTRELHTLMREKGEQTRVTKIGGETPSPAEERLGRLKKAIFFTAKLAT